MRRIQAARQEIMLSYQMYLQIRTAVCGPKMHGTYTGFFQNNFQVSELILSSMDTATDLEDNKTVYKRRPLARQTILCRAMFEIRRI